MLIPINKIDPNPFRNLDDHPLEESRILLILKSIQTTEVWRKMIVRPHPKKKGVFQQAFGHHTIAAIKRFGQTTIDADVVDYNDNQMLFCFAEDNRDLMKTNMSVLFETVGQIRKFLIKTKIGSNQINATSIQLFLGNGWSNEMINFAYNSLSEFDEKILDKKAILTFPNRYQATEFKIAVRKQNLPLEDQLTVAKQVKTFCGEGGGRLIQNMFKKIVTEEPSLGEKVEKEVSKIHQSLVAINGAMHALSMLAYYEGIEQFDSVSIMHANEIMRDVQRAINTWYERSKGHERHILPKRG